MTNVKWDLKSNYILALTVCKYGINPDCWDLVANDIAFYIKTTPQDCKTQFDLLCEEYGGDWQKQNVEPLHKYVFSVIKRLYYGDLYGRMTESRELLMVMYDFIRLFRCGKITSNDINTILQDVKQSVPTDDTTQNDERQQKIQMLERLKFHMVQQMSQSSGTQPLSFPVELLPPPPFLLPQHEQEQSLINNRQTPSINIQQNSNGAHLSTFSQSVQSTNLLADSNQNQINDEDDIDEIELSSDEDNGQTVVTHVFDIDEPTTNSNLLDDEDNSTSSSGEQIETNESSNIPSVPIERSNSEENVSNISISNPSTFSTNAQPMPSNLQYNTSISGSNDYMTLDSDRLQSTENHDHYYMEIESDVTTPNHIPVEDDEVARMDAEQIPELIPADITDVPVPNDNAVFVVDELVSNTTPLKNSTNIEEQTMISENDESVKTKNPHRESQYKEKSFMNFRKSVNSILSNLKTAKYGPDFAKPLKAFRLSTEYYHRIKKPLDIPEIRERMNNGHYDENILLFERDILLMFTNALSMYHRDLDIHGHAQYMMNYALELFTPLEEVRTPWKNDFDKDNGDSTNVFHIDNENETDDDLSTSSSIRMDSFMHNRRISKRQRKTMH